ncbi:PCYCGC motif-containing (lipo)protein [Paenibacillus sp. GCM10023250]|uniref:PCYCGC motif-containing (lipo)protein n=1 Tax=Paenibacillus sp. GCM10023250 TaxID=3252648 RepID=UPI00361DC22E
MRPNVIPTVIGLLSAALFLGGCGMSADKQNHAQNHAMQHAANGDIRETTGSLDRLPAFLDDQPSEVKAAYSIAASVHELLAYIPCYCGCGESAGHQSNLNCFIHEMQADGSVIWDDHGTRCGVCMETAVLTAKLKQEGKSLTDIRNTIDGLYQQGYAAPTPTPMPM